MKEGILSILEMFKDADLKDAQVRQIIASHILKLIAQKIIEVRDRK